MHSSHDLFLKESGCTGGLSAGGAVLTGVVARWRPCARASFSSRLMRRARISATLTIPWRPGIVSPAQPQASVRKRSQSIERLRTLAVGRCPEVSWQQSGRSAATAVMPQALRVTVLEAANLPVPGRFSRPGAQGHLPENHPVHQRVSTPAWTQAIQQPVASVGFLNPYAVVRHKPQSERHLESSRRTRTSMMNACPKWGEHFDFVLDENSVLADRPLLDRMDPTIVIDLWTEDQFSTDQHIATVTVPPATVRDLLRRSEAGVAELSSHQLIDTVGLELRGQGAQPALLNLCLEVSEVDAVPEAIYETPLAGVPPPGRKAPAARSPEKLKEDSDSFFEKLQQSPVWRGRRGDAKAHRHLEIPELPFERFEQRDPKSLLASAGLLEPQVSLLKKFLADVSKRNKTAGTVAKKKDVWKGLKGLGVDEVSLAVMFGKNAASDAAVVEHEEYLGMIAREPAMARGIVDEIARPRVDVDKLLVESREANKAVDILKKFKLIARDYDLHSCNQRVWEEVSNNLDRRLQKVGKADTECQADVDPYEGDLYIRYQQQAPGEKRGAGAANDEHVSNLKPPSHPHLPGAETRPPAEIQGVRAGQVEARAQSAFEGPPSAKMWTHEVTKVRAAFPPRDISPPEGSGGLHGLHRAGEVEPPPPLPDSIHSRVRISTTSAPRPPPSSAAAAAEDSGVVHTETVHQFTHTGT